MTGHQQTHQPGILRLSHVILALYRPMEGSTSVSQLKTSYARIYQLQVLVLSVFSARQHDGLCYIARYMLSPVRPSVKWVDQSKTVEDRIMQLSPQSSPMTSFRVVNFTAKFQRKHRERTQRRRRIREG